MMNPEEYEHLYQTYMNDLQGHVPDGIYDVDLDLLQQLNLLQEEQEEEGPLSHQFYVIESAEKLTLFNQKYVIWITPQLVEHNPITYTLIAINHEDKPHLEIVFTTSGVYNRSTLVLRILEKFLDQIEENEQEIGPLTT